MQIQEHIHNDIASRNRKQVKAALYLLQTHLEDFRGDVNRSYELFKIGEKTELIENLEKALNDPLENLGGVSDAIDQQVKSLVDMLFASYCRYKKNNIQSVYRNQGSGTELTYYIVLKKDNYNERDAMYEFFDLYDNYEISHRYKLYFQFVPIELEPKLTVSHKLYPTDNAEAPNASKS